MVYVLESRDYCQLETFYAACSGDLSSDEPLKVISMLSARYGRMRQDGRCVKRDYGYVGCAADVLAHVDRLCSGRRVCDFPVAELHGNQPCPNDLTPYLEASYECLPGYDTIRYCICNVQSKTDAYSHLSLPHGVKQKI